MSSDIKHLLTWLRIREENGIDFPPGLAQFSADIDHSALLKRLLAGKEPLPIPPPRSYSYPWYELIENGVGYPTEVYETNSSMIWLDYPALIIDQSAWKILETVSDTEWIVTYSYHHKYPEWADGKWRVSQIGSRIPQHPHSVFNKLWKIEKIDAAQT